MLIDKLFRRRNRKSKIIVLMYHRVKTPDTDPWDLQVSAENFEEQVRLLTQQFKVLSENQFTEILLEGKLPFANSILVTFDDAYADNYLNAVPILKKYNCPATFFIPSSFIGSNKYFWWDELEQIILHSTSLPLLFFQHICGRDLEFNLESETLTKSQKEDQAKWKWPDTPPTKRCELYLSIWELLKPLPYHKIELILEQIRQWARFNATPAVESIPMTAGQLKNIINHPGFSLGIHTHTHPSLSSHPPIFQQQEIATCNKYILEYYGVQANAIAFPYGDYNDQTIDILKKQGIETGFTTNAEPVIAGSNRYILGRYQVSDWNAKEFERQLNNWFHNE